MSFDTSFIIDIHQKRMIDSAIQAVNNLELWIWLRDVNMESFMISNDPNVMRIYNEIENVGYNGHSGASFGCTMRQMEFIAKNSFDTYRQNYLANSNQNVSS
jgi:hypothetical protein